MFNHLSDLFNVRQPVHPTAVMSIITVRYVCADCGDVHSFNLAWNKSTAIELSPNLTKRCQAKGRTPIVLENAPRAYDPSVPHHKLNVYQDNYWRIGGFDMDNLLAKSGVRLGEGKAPVHLVLMASLAK